MKNFVAKAILVSSLACAFAMAEGGFMGVEGGYNFKTDLGDGVHDKAPEFGVKGGYEFDAARVYGGYFYQLKADKSATEDDITGKFEWKTHDFVVGADYTPQISGSFKLIAGVYTGVSVLDLDMRANSVSESIRVSDTSAGYILGARLGGAYSFDGNNEIEFGFKASKAWYDGDTSDYLDDINGKKYGVYAGYNYKF